MRKWVTAVFLGIAVVVAGCEGTYPFPKEARAGDTVELFAGWKQSFRRETVTVSITGSDGVPISYPPMHPNVRGVINLYPDPVSWLVVGDRTDRNLPYFAKTFATVIREYSADAEGSNDWWTSLVVVDLPSTLPPGPAEITVETPEETYGPIRLKIRPGRRRSHDLHPVPAAGYRAAGRADHYVVTFSGTPVPHAVELVLTHAPTAELGGVGVPFVTHGTADIKNVFWADNGSSLKVILLPTTGQSLKDIRDLKFYVAGGVSGLAVDSLKSYDADGAELAEIGAKIAEYRRLHQ